MCVRKLRIKLRLIQLSVKLLRKRLSVRKTSQTDSKRDSFQPAPRLLVRMKLSPMPSAGLLHALLPVATSIPPCTYFRSSPTLKNVESRESDVLSTSEMSGTSDIAEDCYDVPKPPFKSDHSLENGAVGSIYNASNCPKKGDTTCDVYENVESCSDNTARSEQTTTCEKEQTLPTSIKSSRRSDSGRTSAAGENIRKARTSYSSTRYRFAPSSPEFTVNSTERKAREGTDYRIGIRGAFVNGLFVPRESSSYAELQEHIPLHLHHEVLPPWIQKQALAPHIALSLYGQGYFYS